jgi:hypothetical protein
MCVLPENKLFLIRRGPPIDGPSGTLAGVAEYGDTVVSQKVGSQEGSWVNRGSKESPKWERPPGSVTITYAGKTGQ